MKVLHENGEPTAETGKELLFYCPGCQQYHAFVVERQMHPVWTWNGNLEKPTFTPSLLVHGSTDKPCHLYVVNGQIQYLSDCFHDLRGQTVDMQQIDW